MTVQQLFDSLELEDLSEEEHRIRSWRMEQFRSLRFDLVSAALLAESDVDLAVARGLAARGCPPDVAARILL